MIYLYHVRVGAAPTHTNRLLLCVDVPSCTAECLSGGPLLVDLPIIVLWQSGAACRADRDV